MKETIVLDGLNLREYIKEKRRGNKPNGELDAMISACGGPEGNNSYEVERKALSMLCEQRAAQTYRGIDFSFLEMSNPYTHRPFDDEKETINLPRFTVHPLSGPGTFSVNLTLLRDIGAGDFRTVSFGPVPAIFADHLAKSCLPNNRTKLEKKGNSYKFFNKKECRAGSDFRYEFEASCNLLFPISTREKLNEARRSFRVDQLYIVKETKPKEWQRVGLLDDPLLVGITEKNGYLIDHFNATRLEQYVVDEFVVDGLGR